MDDQLDPLTIEFLSIIGCQPAEVRDLVPATAQPAAPRRRRRGRGGSKSVEGTRLRRKKKRGKRNVQARGVECQCVRCGRRSWELRGQLFRVAGIRCSSCGGNTVELKFA